jgi:PAS domain S-box-containing protein
MGQPSNPVPPRDPGSPADVRIDGRVKVLLAGALVFLGLYLISLRNFLLSHAIAETFSICAAGTVFLVSWNTRRRPEDAYFSFLGIGMLFVALLDLLHSLAYKGMGVFPAAGANLPTQLWIADRYVFSITYLAAPWFAGRRLDHRIALAAYAAATAVLLASIFAWGIFPDCYIEGVGLTPFKIASEYVISGIFLASIVFLFKKKDRFEPRVLHLLVSAAAVAVASEMAFTLYTDVYGLSNLIGHFLEILSFYLIYQAIVGTDLVRQYELNRQLQEELAERQRAQEEVRKAKEELEKRVDERTAELTGLALRLRGELKSRQEAEERLARQTGLLESVLLSVGEGVTVADREGNFLVFNPEAERILRLGATGPDQEHWAERYGLYLSDAVTLCPTEQLPMVRAIRGESFNEFELFVRYGPGPEGVWVSCSGRQLQGRDGEVQGGVVAFRDVTARRRGEKALRDSTELLEKVFSNIHLSVVHLDRDFRFLRVNQVYADACGHPPEFFTGKNHFDLFPHAENEVIFRQVVETGEPFYAHAKPFVFRDHSEWGTTYWDWSLLPIQDPKGKVTSLTLCLVDVTERAKTLRELRESEERFRALVENSPVGISIVQEGRIIFRNPEQVRLFGPMPDDFELRAFRDVLPDDAEKFAELCAAVSPAEIRGHEMDLRFYPYGKGSDGVDMRWVHVIVSPMEHRGGKAALMIMADITLLKEMEFQFLVREKMAALGHVAAGIAHEIRNPLSGINIHLSALEKALEEDAGMEADTREQAEGIIGQIKTASARIEGVIKKVMDFSRPGAPRMEMADLSLAIEEALDFSATSLRKSGITLDRSGLSPLPNIPANPSLITQVVMNLITNAAQAMERQAAPKRIAVSTGVESGRAVLRISDSGPGVPSAMRIRIFDPFFTTRRDGYGIGLSLCQRIIADHGGIIAVETSRWGGAEFRIEIPLEPMLEAEPRQPS